MIADWKHQPLAVFAGRWIGHGQTHPSPWGAGSAATAHWSARFDTTGLFLIVDYDEQRDDGTSFSGHGVMMVDPESDDMLWFFFDSFGFPPLKPARGNWSGTSLTLSKETARGQGRTTLRSFGNKFEQEISSKVNGAPDWVLVSSMSFGPA